MNTLLLAAGLSTRMGTQKLLLPFEGSTIIETVITTLYMAGLSPVYAVFSKEVNDALKFRLGSLQSSINPEPHRGQSSSLAIGLEMLPDNEDFCIMLGDLPCVRDKDISELAQRFKSMQRDKTVLTPFRNGAFGHPMFYRAIWKERFKLAQGDTGGRKILFKYEKEIVRVDAPYVHFRDLDTPDDYKNLVKDN